MSSTALLEDRKALPVWMGLQQKVPVGNPALEVLRELAAREQLRALPGLLSQSDALHAPEETLVGARLEFRQIADALEGALVNQGRHSHLGHRVALAELHVVDAGIRHLVVMDVLPNVVEVPIIDWVHCHIGALARGPVDVLAPDRHRVLCDSAPSVRRFTSGTEPHQEGGVLEAPLEVLDHSVEVEPLVSAAEPLGRLVPGLVLHVLRALRAHPYLALARLPAPKLSLRCGRSVGQVERDLEPHTLSCSVAHDAFDLLDRALVHHLFVEEEHPYTAPTSSSFGESQVNESRRVLAAADRHDHLLEVVEHKPDSSSGCSNHVLTRVTLRRHQQAFLPMRRSGRSTSGRPSDPLS